MDAEVARVRRVQAVADVVAGRRRNLVKGAPIVVKRGYDVVAASSRGELEDAFAIEGVLSGMAAVRASRRVTEADIETLVDLDARMVSAGSATRWHVMAELDAQIHLAIARLSGSRKLFAALQETAVDRVADLSGLSGLLNCRATMNHKPIIEAMRSCEHDIAGDVMRSHVVESGRDLIDRLTAAGVTFGR